MKELAVVVTGCGRCSWGGGGGSGSGCCWWKWWWCCCCRWWGSRGSIVRRANRDSQRPQPRATPPEEPPEPGREAARSRAGPAASRAVASAWPGPVLRWAGGKLRAGLLGNGQRQGDGEAVCARSLRGLQGAERRPGKARGWNPPRGGRKAGPPPPPPHMALFLFPGPGRARLAPRVVSSSSSPEWLCLF